ncbi:MAG TPA: 3-dehydroquinate synthase [Acetobacteraceae bacterium]|nr:3-dehydroquinate synthase [Acetobacteraceae bacterium]
MTRNTVLHPFPVQSAVPEAPRPAAWNGPTIVLVGLMGAGKTAIGRRLALRLGLPFRDADHEIETAAGCTVAEFFEKFGEAEFRAGERRVIRRLLAGPPCVLATGGGAFMDTKTRAAIRAEARSVWLRCDLTTLVRRTSGRHHRPLLRDGDPASVLANLMRARHPVYAEADIVVDCGDDSPDVTTGRVAEALLAYRPAHSLDVPLGAAPYQIVIGEGLIARAGAWLAPALPQKRAVVVTDSNVAALHLPALMQSLGETGFEASQIVVAPGEGSKTLAVFGQVTDALLAAGVERRTAVIALGGGVIGDLAGFAAACTMRGLPFAQVPTTLLAQVDSSVGGKTGINTAHGKNLLGAFHQPRIVLADTAALATLPPRELRAGYAEIVKAGLIGEANFFAWCETNGPALLAGDATLQAEAVERACAFKAAVVADDEREEKPNDGRALLNLGHTFAHALEAEYFATGGLLHGEAVAIGLGLAFALSEKLELCPRGTASRIKHHIAACGMLAEIGELNRRFSAQDLLRHMRHDKKMRDGRLAFVLARDIGQAFTSRDVPEQAVLAVLRDAGCGA